MAIEIAPEEYHKEEITYSEALVYCFSLNIDGKIGWRLPTDQEYVFELPDRYNVLFQNCNYFDRNTATCIPVRDVRDLKDD
jgi:hypothetical protein